jgi:hypothetical protein
MLSDIVESRESATDAAANLRLHRDSAAADRARKESQEPRCSMYRCDRFNKLQYLTERIAERCITNHSCSDPGRAVCCALIVAGSVLVVGYRRYVLRCLRISYEFRPTYFKAKLN